MKPQPLISKLLFIAILTFTIALNFILESKAN